MRFPTVKDIANKNIVYIDITQTIGEAIEMMIENNHRNMLILDKNEFRILTAHDVFRVKKETISLDKRLDKFNLKIIPTITLDKNVLDTLPYLNSSIEYICVLDLDGNIYGLVTHTDITTNIDPNILMDNYRLSDFLKLGRRMRWVDKEASTSELLDDMSEDNFDNLIVVEDLIPIGILTTKDVIKLIRNQSDLNLPIKEYMSSPVDAINKNASIKEALDFLHAKKYKRVVVVDDDGKLGGIIAQKELISLTYSKWAMLMQEYQEELSEINNMLKDKNKKYEALATKDPLTGLYNRYKFSELYVTSYKTMIQRDNDMSLIMLDIDKFKKVNDTYGHNIGDQVLIQVAHALIRNLRNIDIVCRWGGEEFLMLLPTASLENAIKLADKIRIHIAELSIDVVGGVTASFGVAKVRLGDTMEEVVDRADKALYLAKDSGRNCVKSELES